MNTTDKAHTEPDPHVCGRCALQGPTCCRIPPAHEELCFPLSKIEWDRILDFQVDKGSFVQTPNTAPFVTNLRRLFPHEHALIGKLFPSHGVHLRLATGKDGACVFLRDAGCSLPREVRPYYCRIFPFWVISGRISLFNPDYCLAIKEQPRVNRLLPAMGMSAKTVLEMHGRLRLAWGMPPKEGMPLAETVFSRQKK